MNPYLSEKARGEIPRFLKWLRNAGLAFCVFCSVGGLRNIINIGFTGTCLAT